MSTIINATTTNGVVIQPDNSGSLVLQTNSGTTALTIDTSQRAAFVAGTAAAPAITTSGDTNTGIFFPAADTIAFAEGGTETMRLDSSGNVGIGVTPAYKLDIASTAQLRVASSAGNAAGFELCGNGTTYNSTSLFVGQGSTNIGYLYQRANEALVFGTNNIERMRITSDGLLQFNNGYGSVATAYGCRAWVNFNGTGTVAIRDSGNVTSITDHAVGKYTINFTTAMPDANYSVAGSALHTDGTGFAMTVSLTSLATPVAGSCRISVAVPTIGFADPSVVDVAVFR